MNIPNNLKYTEEHEWIRLEANNIAYVGITDYAQSELGDIVFVEIETVGQELKKHDVFGTVEAVKTVSDLYLPVSAKIIEKNEVLNSDPETVNKDPYQAGWLIKIQITQPEEINELLSHEKYSELIG